MARLKIKIPGSEKHKTGSKGEEEFAFHLKLTGLPAPVRELRFSKLTNRLWRFDFAWPDLKIAVEIEGLTHYGTNADGSRKTSRHQTAKGYQSDLDKYNQAAIEGWRVLRFSQHQVKSGVAIEVTENLLLNVTPPKPEPVPKAASATCAGLRGVQ
jgi:very-short-patch-repair endonuclease